MPKRELSTEEIAHPEKVFYTGQVVKCHVLSWNTDKGTLTLSFKVGNALFIMYQQRSTFKVFPWKDVNILFQDLWYCIFCIFISV